MLSHALIPRRAMAGGLLLLAVACARMGPPAGGPEDKVPPVLLATVPESVGSYTEWDRDVEFRFDEVISEGGSPNVGVGTGDLEKLVLLSPSRGVPVVRWKRDRITVRPKEGWKRGRVYRVELLPGVADLRRNRLDTTTVLTFSTGGPPPTDTLRGLVIDWTQGRVARAAILEFVLGPDSLAYRAVSDSSGRYAVGPLPRGEYVAYAAIDQNRNTQRERREAFDSAVVAAGVVRIPPLWIIPRDTLGPRLTQVTVNDSVSATLTFSGPLDPYQPPESLGVRLRLLPDSTPVPVRSLLPKAKDDSLQQRARAVADSVRAAQDTTPRDTSRARPAPAKQAAPAGGFRPGAAGPRTDPEADSIIATRPKLTDKLVLRVDSAFAPESRLVVEVLGIRSAAGVRGDARNALVIPKRPEKPATDTLQATPPDSTAQPAPPPAKP